jgi:hypothetical protein
MLSQNCWFRRSLPPLAGPLTQRFGAVWALTEAITSSIWIS